MMCASRIGLLRAAIAGLALFACTAATTAQNPNPSPAALATAREIIDLKGLANIFNPVFVGVIEKAKFTLMQSNPMLQKDLNEVAIKLRTDLQPRLDELKEEAARIYARRFTEAELKQALAFYQSPIGRKLTATEPQVLEQSMVFANQWTEKLAEEALVKIRAEMRKRGHEL